MRKTLRHMESFGRERMKYSDCVWRWRRFQGPVVTLAMLSMHLWIIQLRRRRDLSWRDFAQQLCILFEQSVDGLGHLTSHTTDHPRLANVGLRPFIIRAFGFDQSVIEPGPFIVPQPNSLHDSEKQDLLHRPGSSACQSGVIQGAPRLSDDG